MPFQVLSFLHPHILATIKKYLLANHFSKAVKVWSGFTNYPSFMSQNPHIHSRDSRLTEVSIRDSRSQGCIASSFFLWCSWQFSRTERVLAVHAFSAMAKGHPQRAPPKELSLVFKIPGQGEEWWKLIGTNPPRKFHLDPARRSLCQGITTSAYSAVTLESYQQRESIWFWTHSEPCLTKSIVPCK